MGWSARIRNLWRRGKVDAEIEAELRAHMEMAVEDGVRAGMTEEEARRAARGRFGNPVTVRERTVGADAALALDGLWHDVRYALRQLRRSPGFALTAALTLALGIGANTAIFTLVHAILLEQLPFQDPGRVFSVQNGVAAGLGYNIGSKDFVAAFDHAADSMRTMDAAALYSTSGVNVDVPGGVAARRVATETSTQFLRVLGVTPELGRGFLANEDVPGNDHVVLISDGFWRGELGGDAGVLGRTLEVNGFEFRIVGVLPAAMNFPAKTDFWTPTIFDEHTALREAGAFFTSLVVRARAGTSAGALRSKLVARATTLAGHRLPQELTPEVTPIAAELTKSIRSSLLMLTGAVLLVLLIACANLACLMLVRVARRRGELAVRAALGAGRRRMMQQQMVECLLLAAGGGGAGIAVAYGALRLLLALHPATLRNFAPPALDMTALAFTGIASLATGLAFGVAPAWHASREDPVEAMKVGAGRGSPHGSRLRKALVAGEMAVTLLLLTSAALLVRTLGNLDRVPLGYRVQGLLTFSISLHGAPYIATQGSSTPALIDFYNGTLEHLRAIPGVSAAGAVSSLPLDPRPDMLLPVSGSPMGASARLTAANRTGTIAAAPRFASRGYFGAMGIPLVAGRDFSPHDTHTSQKVVILSSDLAKKLWPGQNPVGRTMHCLWFCQPAPVVIGVVAATHQFGPRHEVEPEYFMSYAQQDWPYLTFVLRTRNDPQGLVAEVRRAVAAVDPTQPVYDMRTMQQRLYGNESLVRFELFLLSVFAGVAVALVAIGLYGVIAYSVAGRRHEIGVRLALGAERGRIMRAVLCEGALLALAGAAIGLGCALGVMRVLRATLFGVTAHDPLTLASVCALVLVVGTGASYWPARRAAGVDPMQALRSE